MRGKTFQLRMIKFNIFWFIAVLFTLVLTTGSFVSVSASATQQAADGPNHSLTLKSDGTVNKPVDTIDKNNSATGECFDKGWITITEIEPSRETSLEIGKTYTFTITVKYQFDESTTGYIVSFAYDAGTNDELDRHVDEQIKVSSQSGKETISVTAKMSHYGEDVSSIYVGATLVGEGFNCSNVADTVRYTVNDGTTTPTPTPTPTPSPSPTPKTSPTPTQDQFSVEEHLMTDISGDEFYGKYDNCTTPPKKTTFLNTDPLAGLWYSYRNAKLIDTEKKEFYAPDGTLYETSNNQFLGVRGCWYDFIKIKGSSAASKLGEWQVKVYRNDRLLFTEIFTIQEDTSSKGSSYIYGFVYDLDVNALRGVTVTITGNNFSESTETNEDGLYSFDNLEADDYTLTYEKEGYQTQTKDISLEEGEELDLGTITLEEVEKGKISGTVVDIKGDPIENVRLKLLGLKTKATLTDASDADGFFEFPDLEADTYIITTKKKGYRKGKKSVKVEEGETKEIEIELRKTTRRDILVIKQ